MATLLNLSTVTLFREIPTFSSLDSAELSEVVRHMQPFNFGPGERFFAQGDPSDAMYVIERGEAVVLASTNGTDRVVLAELGNGAIVGELALIDGSPRSATVETIALTSGHVLTRERFDALRSTGSLAAYKIVLELARTLEQRRRVTEQRLRRLIDAHDRSDALGSRELRELFGRLLKG